MTPQTTDPFDDLLTLEDTLYTSAHTKGQSDGARAGRIEGRIFGLEKGFEKFAALGQLHGRGAVWGSRLRSSTMQASSSQTSDSTTSPTTSPQTTDSTTSPQTTDSTTSPQTTDSTTSVQTTDSTTLPPFSNPTPRLLSNTTLLYHLTDPLTFSTSNTEASVADYDDRVKRAGAKAKVVERMVGEAGSTTGTGGGGATSINRTTTAATPTATSTATPATAVRLQGEAKTGGKSKGGDSMEDFAGSRLIG